MASRIDGEMLSSGWLRDQRFDLTFTVGLPALALASGAVVLLNPALLMPVLLADLWLLGYHHVVSTFTRLCFDRDSLRRYRFLVFGLPPLVAIGCFVAVAAASGVWILVSVYFYWQWFHYTRQSWGIAQGYRRKAGIESQPGMLDTVMFYALPVAGIVTRSAQEPETFLSMPIRFIPVSETVASGAILLASVLVALWIHQTIRRFRNGQIGLPYLLYLISHHVIFATAYLVIPDVTVGWLVVNIWHNGQYILFVWMFNNRRFSAGISPRARLLSWLSQDERMWGYMAACVLLSTVVYWTIGNVLPLAFAMPLFIVYQIINFHHYVVDAVIWRRRHLRDALQAI